MAALQAIVFLVLLTVMGVGNDISDCNHNKTSNISSHLVVVLTSGMDSNNNSRLVEVVSTELVTVVS